jgi:hypothetical protein
MITVRLDAVEREIHVTRAILCYAWEGYHAGDNVYLSRQTQKWIHELVGSITVDTFALREELCDELIAMLFHAVVGTSRLPLTSVEAPLPGFSLGELAYVYRAGSASVSMRSPPDLIEQGLCPELSDLESAKLLEAVLRSNAPEDIDPTIQLFAVRWSAIGRSRDELPRLYRRLFNEVALSPYTSFVQNTLVSVAALVKVGVLTRQDEIDFLSYLIRHNARHLTAYDLETFHHRGANYPDALLLDEVLRAYLLRMESNPELFSAEPSNSDSDRKRKQIRRRALRQGWLLWRLYQGLPVPEVPTSPGENARVLPPPLVHISDDQILAPAARTRRLYAGIPQPELSPLGDQLLRQSIEDLEAPTELRELGMAVYLDRPLGRFKASSAPDRTPLLSYEAFSRAAAERRLHFMSDKLGLIQRTRLDHLQSILRRPAPGARLRASGGRQRPGAVSLDDALRIADDFVLLRSTRQTIQAFLELFDFSALFERAPYLRCDRHLLIVDRRSIQPATAGISVFDEGLQERLQLEIDDSNGYRTRAGLEFPVGGLRLTRIWERGNWQEVNTRIRVRG